MAVYESSSEEETAKIAADLACRARGGDVFLLNGALGAGKSVFGRAFIRALCGEDTEVPSPTYTLVQTYESAKGTIWHFDLYRLQDPDEVFEIGWEEAMSGGILLIEWPERLGHHLPAKAHHISIETASPTKRKIILHD